jgi:flagellar motility protein MotE (MotC chaperone)
MTAFTHRIATAAGTFLPRFSIGWRSRSLLLPVAAGLTALLPWHAANLLHSWHAWSPAMASAAPEVPKNDVMKGGGAQVVTSDGGAAQRVSAATLAGIDHIGTAGDNPPEGHLLAELSRRKTELARREQDLQRRETQLAVAVQLARKQMAELTRMRQTLDALVGREATAAEADLVLLVGIYSNMKPMQAAAVLGKLEAPKAAAILQRLDTRMAGPILASMDPSAALAITEELQQRRAVLRQ